MLEKTDANSFRGLNESLHRKIADAYSETELRLPSANAAKLFLQKAAMLSDNSSALLR